MDGRRSYRISKTVAYPVEEAKPSVDRIWVISTASSDGIDYAGRKGEGCDTELEDFSSQRGELLLSISEMGQVCPSEFEQKKSSSLNLEKYETSVAIALNRMNPMAVLFSDIS